MNVPIFSMTSNKTDDNGSKIESDYGTGTSIGIDIYEVPISLTVIFSIFYAFIIVVAVVGNTLVIYVVFISSRMRTVTNFYIANLAFADVTIAVFCIPFQFHAALVQRWDLPEFMCKFCPFAQTLSVNVSIFTLLVISHDR